VIRTIRNYHLCFALAAAGLLISARPAAGQG
jgi:hypothetical protein